MPSVPTKRPVRDVIPTSASKVSLAAFAILMPNGKDLHHFEFNGLMVPTILKARSDAARESGALPGTTVVPVTITCGEAR